MRTGWIGAGCLAVILMGCAERRLVRNTPLDRPPQVPEVVKRAKAMPAGDQPDKAAEFYLLKRTGAGDGDLPAERYEAARQRMERMPVVSVATGRGVTSKAGKQADLGAWQALGPGNQGGRTKSLLIHPQDAKTMYAGAVTGGVFKTVDGGQNWTAMSDVFPTLGLGALAMDPSNPEVLYAGTGFWFNTLSGTNVFGSAPRGAGIFRSRDGAATWEPLGNPGGNLFRYINDIVVSRGDAQRLYVSTWAGIFRSLDGGQRWTQVLNRGTGVLNGCQDMVMRTDQATDYLFAACGTTVAGDAGIFRNTDAGGEGRWEKVFSVAAMGNTTLALAPSNQSVVYALMASNGEDDTEWRNSLHGVYRSTTNGDVDTWEARVTNKDETQVNTGLLSTNQGFYANQCSANGEKAIGGQGWIHNAIAVDPQDPERVYVGGIDIYRSDDGGKNWGIASFWQAAETPTGAHADVLALVFPPDYDGGAKQQMFAATDGGIYLTENARAAVATGERAGCTPFQNRVAWKPLHTGYQSTQFYTGSVLPGGGVFYGGKQDNGTMRGSLAGQKEWVRIRGGDGAAVATDPRDPNTLFVSTQNFSLTRSRNGGKTLATSMRGITEPSANFAFIAPLAMDLKNPDRLYAGGRTLWRTTNQADTWEAMSAQLPTAQGNVSAIAVSPADGRVVMATSQGFVLRTANALEATAETVWEATRPRPGYVTGVTFDPVEPEVVYVVYSQFNTAAGQSHVYRSRDGGRTWEGIDGKGDTGIPDIPVFCLLIDPEDSQRLYAGTDLGVFVTMDGGANWERDSNPFAAVPVETLALDRGAGASYLYAFTFGRGVWRTQLPSSGTACSYEVGGLGPMPAFGGTTEVPVTTGEGCVWSAIPQAGAVDVASPATGTGTGLLRLTTLLNFSTAARRGGFWLHDKTVELTQAGALQVPVAADASATPAVIAALPYVGIRDSRTTTAEASDPQASCATTVPAKTIWWRVTAPQTGEMEVVMQGQRYDVAGNSGLVVSAYVGTTELGCVATPRGTGAWVYRSFRFAVTRGSTYSILGSATGSTALDGGYTILGVRMIP
ncbi:MAG: hypothetical protein NTV52_21835 [Acidobacteria bacterium]|nr:hypothetical protein [Acidobacteriota bacterium]